MNITVEVMHTAKEELSKVPNKYKLIDYIECILRKKSGFDLIPIPIISFEMTIHNHVSIMIQDQGGIFKTSSETMW